MVVENAFGWLKGKGRWQCLLNRRDVHVSNVPYVVRSCVVLCYTIYVKYMETISGKMTLKLLKLEVPQLQSQHPAVPQSHAFVMLSGITFSSVYCYFIIKCNSALLFA